MWKTFIQNLWPDAEFHSPALPVEIQTTELQVSITFPAELKALLSETDGVVANCGTSYIYRVSLKSEPYHRFAEQNLTMRTTPDLAGLYAPFGNIFFIGEDGGGSLFGYEINDGKCTNNIVYWEHEDDSRVIISTNGLKGYLEYAVSMYSD